MSSNPFTVALQEAIALLPYPPAAYRYRLIGQFVLCALQIVVCAIFLGLHLLHAKRRGQSLWLVRLRRESASRSGFRRITTNNIPTTNIFAVLAGIAFTVSRWQEWITYVDFDASKQQNRVIASFLPYFPMSLHAWMFTHSNLVATLTVRERLGSYQSPFNGPLVQNILLIGWPTILWIALLPPVIIANQFENRLSALFLSIVAVLTKAAADYGAGRPVDWTAIGQAQEDGTALLQSGLKAEFLVYVISIIVTVALAISAAFNLCTLYLLLELRGQRSAIRKRKASAGNIIEMPTLLHSQAEDVGALAPSSEKTRGLLDERNLSERREPGSPIQLQQLDGSLHENEQAELALSRLTVDLSIAIPSTILICLALGSVSMFGVVTRAKINTWTRLEFTNDAATYVYCPATIVINLLLIVNQIRHWGDPTPRLLSASDMRSTFASSTSSANANPAEADGAGVPSEVDVSFRDMMRGGSDGTVKTGYAGARVSHQLSA